MILADTSVWVDHMRNPDLEFSKNLSSRNVLMHTMVMGELACGNIRDRSQQLIAWDEMPKAARVTDEKVLAQIESGRFMGRGIGFIDAHLLCSVLEEEDVLLWTRDLRLKKIAEEFGVAFSEESRRKK